MDHENQSLKSLNFSLSKYSIKIRDVIDSYSNISYVGGEIKAF